MCCSSARNVLLNKAWKGRQAQIMSSASATQKEPILPVERTPTRLSILVPALLAFVAPAVAENWQEYRYPDQFFAVAFPDDPQAETTTYQVADDRSVDARVYSVRQDNAVFKMTVAEIADTGLDESAIIDHALKTMSEGGEVKVNIPHRINRIYGRQLSIVGWDGIRSMAALFDYNGRLYQIEGKALPNQIDATADAIRFVQSLIFTGGGSNRSAEQIRAAQAACSGPGGPGGAPAAVAGDGRRFKIRCRRQQSLAALVTSLNSGDLSGARQAYSSLSQFQRFANPNRPFGQAMSQIGQALQDGDLSAAQQALSSLEPGQRSRQP
jgi:hypothetical protein